MHSPDAVPPSDIASSAKAPQPKSRHKHRARLKPFLGNIAIILGIIGLLLSFFGGDIADKIQPMPAFSERVADYAVNIRDTVVSRLLNRNAEIVPPPSYHWHTLMPKLALGFAITALTLGLVAIIRGERKIIARTAMYMGTLGIAWYGMMIVASIYFTILFIGLLLIVLGELGFDFGAFSIG